MKKIQSLLLTLLLLCGLPAFAASNVINLYNWSGYLPEDVIRDFEKESGIRVSYSTYDSNETMYAKLKASPDAGYDLIVPSTYFVDRMRRQNMLHKIDKSRLPNIKYLNPSLLNKNFDLGNEYSVPYFWGTTAIAINAKYHPKGSITKWNDFWKPKYKNQLLILNDTREVFAMALISLGYSANDTNPDHIKEAYLKLKKLLPNIKLFNAEAEEALYIDEDVAIGMAWSGDIYMSKKENPALEYIYPQEGFVVWMDSLSIPARAPHIDNVYKFLNFLMRPEVAKRIGLATGYASANAEAVKLMPQEIRNNVIIYPSQQVLQRGQFQVDIGASCADYEKYLELLKIGG